jgi:hypothetical protein
VFEDSTNKQQRTDRGKKGGKDLHPPINDREHNERRGGA